MATVFRPRPLPESVARCVRERLRDAHDTQPFSTADARETVKRVRALLADLPVVTTVYRGGLDLRGAEVDHVWVGLTGNAGQRTPAAVGAAATYVLDVAFPLFEGRFVAVLRRFVAGEADADELEAVAAPADLDTRVLGDFPTPMRYLGEPVWAHRG